MNETVSRLWPELEWIEDARLRAKTSKVWEYALSLSSLDAEDLERIPFTLLAEKAVGFMAHKRSVVHICRDSALKMVEFYGDRIPIDMDVLVSGAILIDVGKLLEYEKDDAGKIVQSEYGRKLRHPFSGVGLAMRFDIPEEVCHVIATHSKEGEGVRRSAEAVIAHHADFMTFEPFLLT